MKPEQLIEKRIKWFDNIIKTGAIAGYDKELGEIKYARGMFINLLDEIKREKDEE